MDLESLKKEFSNPASTYRLAPFWFLNHELEDSELTWQINEMNRKGVGGFILHPRHGLITPYLSEEWMNRMDTCIKEADKLRMKAYLYDENNWPSGPVDGELIEKYPDYNMSGCFLSQEWIVQGGKRLKEQIDFVDGLIAIVAVPVGRGKRLEGLPQSAVSLVEFLNDKTLDWTAPAGSKWQVMVFTRKFLKPYGFFGGYLDTLSRQAVAKFIEMTHEKYAERFADYFGGTVDGIFTDEPAMSYNPDPAVPWTPTLPSEFNWRNGYDIIGALPAVFKDAGPVTAQLRCDFHKTTTELYAQAFFKQIYEWCDKRRLNFIGHVACEGEFYCHTRNQGDFFQGAKYMHFGGVDFLTESTWPDVEKPGRLNNLIGPKLASSAAHIYGKPRVMSEAFGLASVWQIDLRNLKWMTDWQIALGVNLIEPHAFYYSIQGFRKWECPPGEFYQSSFWPYYDTYADYTARLCSALAGGFHVADVAVVFPVRAMWSAINPQGYETDNIVKTFEKVTSALLQAGFDFDIVPEETLVYNMDPTDLEHFDSLEQYKAIIIPECTTLLEETAHFLGICIQDGNAVLACGDVPKTLVTDSAHDWAGTFMTPELLADQFNLEYDWGSGEMKRRRSSIEPDALSAIIPAVADRPLEDVTQAVSTSLRELIHPDVIVRAKGENKPYVADIVHCHYQRGDVDFIFLVNTSRTEAYQTTVWVNALGVPALWDARTGDVKLIESYEFENEMLKLTLDFEPTQAHLISISPVEIWEPSKSLEKQGKEKVTQLGDEWEFSTLKPNVLPLADWRFSMGGGAHGSWGYGWHEYITEFECDTKLSEAKLLIDGLLTEKLWRRSTPIHVEITLNDQPVKEFEQGSYLDHLIREADVSGLVKQGKNTLKIRTNTELAPAGSLTDPAYLIGNFALEGKPGSWKLVKEPGKVKTGSWAEQGYPYFSGIGSYRQKIKLAAPKGKVMLRMEKPADMAEVLVNGKQAGVLPWEPWQVEITDFIKEGTNEIEIRVANSMHNLLVMEPKVSGLIGKVEIVELQ